MRTHSYKHRPQCSQPVWMEMGKDEFVKESKQNSSAPVEMETKTNQAGVLTEHHVMHARARLLALKRCVWDDRVQRYNAVMLELRSCLANNHKKSCSICLLSNRAAKNDLGQPAHHSPVPRCAYVCQRHCLREPHHNHHGLNSQQ